MILRVIVSALLVALSISPVVAQPDAPKFTVADVHPAPRRSYPFYFAVLLPDNRLVVRDATLIDLISTAWDLDPENVQGGPNWLELDRFDIIAKVPPGTSKANQKLMVRALLAERFHVALGTGTKPLPAFTLKTSGSANKMKQSEGPGESHCDRKPPTTPALQNSISCHNMPMEELAQTLHNFAGGYLDKPVVDDTKLEGAWDFDLSWSNAGSTPPGAVSIFEAVEKQLGLKLALETAPRSVITVSSADRKPTPNAGDLDKIFPTPALPQFEVATIKPSKPGEHGSGSITGSEVNFNNIALKDMVDLAWDLNESDDQVVVNAPKWLAEERFDILAKVSPESAGHPLSGNIPMDIYEVEEMLRALLVERFQIKAHMEDRPIDAYTLVAANPKLKPAADPSARTLCKTNPAPATDPNPAINRHITCRNISMADFTKQLEGLAGGYLFQPVLDATGIKGTFDIALNLTGASQFNRALQAAGVTTDAPAVLSLFEAVTQQLGLKLEKQKRPLPVLVLEHIEPKPTEN